MIDWWHVYGCVMRRAPLSDVDSQVASCTVFCHVAPRLAALPPEGTNASDVVYGRIRTEGIQHFDMDPRVTTQTHIRPYLGLSPRPALTRIGA